MSKRGKVVFFDDIKGMGLIDDGETPKNFLVDYDQIIVNDERPFKSLNVGDRVVFNKRQGRAYGVEIKQKAQELPLVAQVLDVKMSEVPTRVKTTIIDSLPEKQKEFTSYIFKQNVISPSQAMKDLNLRSKSQFEELDRSAAEAIQSTFATFHGGNEGQTGGGWGVDF